MATTPSDFGQKPRRASFRFRGILNISMGLLYFIFAGYIISTHHFIRVELSTGLSYALGGLLVLYGAFRIWRGIRDFKDARDPDADY